MGDNNTSEAKYQGDNGNNIQLKHHETNELELMQAIAEFLMDQLVTFNCSIMRVPENKLNRQGHGGGYIKFGQWLFTNNIEIVQYFNINKNYLTVDYQL